MNNVYPSSQTLMQQIDANTILHPASSISQIEQHGTRIMHSGKGVTVTDASGNQYIDAVGGLWCVNVGYGHPELAKEMAEASEQLAYFHTFGGASNEAQIKLAQQLLIHAPESLGKVFFGCSGSDANDTLLKLMWHYQTLRGKPTKTKVISRRQAYHGTSVATASLTGLASFHRHFPLPQDFVLHTSPAFYYRDGLPGETERAYSERLVAELEALILREGADNIGAFIAEPIMGAGGVITPPEGYFDLLQACLKKHDILFIVDEVVCGFGRTGHWFASEYYGLNPDMMATAKGITSGYFPLSAAFISDKIWQELRLHSEQTGGLAHGYTYSGHPVGAAVGLKNLSILNSQGLIGKSADAGAYLLQQLQGIVGDHPHVGEVRGVGLLAGIQLVADKATRQFYDPNEKIAAKVAAEAHKLGVIVRALPSVSTLALSPPLCISRDEIDQVVAAIAVAIQKVLG